MCFTQETAVLSRLTWKKVERVDGRNLACDIHGSHLVWRVERLDSDHIWGQQQTTVVLAPWGPHEGRVLLVRWGDGAWGSHLWNVDAAGGRLCPRTASRRL